MVIYYDARSTNHQDTQTSCVIIIAFPMQQWLQEHASFLRCMYVHYLSCYVVLCGLLGPWIIRQNTPRNMGSHRPSDISQDPRTSHLNSVRANNLAIQNRFFVCVLNSAGKLPTLTLSQYRVASPFSCAEGGWKFPWTSVRLTDQDAAILATRC
jgi:hypothetical protein